MKLASVSIRQPVFAVMLIAGLVVLGFVSLGRLEVDLNPDVEFPFVTVMTRLAGASPETVEREVTDVLEEELNTIEGVRTLRSTSSEGLSQVFIEFELESDVDTKAQEVRDKLSAARPLLPLDIDEPVVQRLDPDAAPIISVMLGGNVSVRELSEVADAVVAARIERLAGVGNVKVIGSRDREIRVWVDPVRLVGYGLSIEDVSGAVRRENAELAGGRIEGPTREWAVTTAGRVSSIADFGTLIVAERQGHLVYLRDVAVVEDGMADEHSIARLNGQRGVSLEVRRQSGANTVAVARRVRAEVDQMRALLPAGMTILVARDLARFIERSIESVFVDMVYGGILAIAVVLLFLRNTRSTLIASLAIPSSVIASFTLFYVAGFTLNTMTLMALSLSIGLVIDDAIVVLENVYRRMEAGEPRRVAAEVGSAQVGLAVVSTTLAVCAVFVPIAFMRGMMGQWFYEFGLVVAMAVSVSTLVALTLTPMLASRILSVDRAPARVYLALESAQRRLEEGYRGLLDVALRRKGLTVAFALATVIGGCGVASTLPFDLFLSGDRGEFMVTAKFPVGTPLPVTSRLTRRIEELLAEQPYVHTVFATAGSELQRRSNESSIFVGIADKSRRDASQTQVVDHVRRVLRESVPEAEEIGVGPIEWISMGGRTAQVHYTLRGPELERLSRHAAALVLRMRQDPIFADVASSYETGKPEVALEIARDRAADLGVPATAVGRTIRALLAGDKVGSFEEAGRRFDIRVQVLPEYRDDPAKLDLIHVRSLRGELVPLTNVARVRIGEGAVEVHRENRARQISLFANLAGEAPLGDATAKLEAWGEQIGITAPDELVATARAKAMQETGSAMLFALALALVSIYMILASLFNSFLHPLTIMMSAPLSFIGGFLALKLAGMSIDLMSGIGLLVLMGLVMKNGILLVDYANQLRAEGRSREEAMREAGPVRMRPVLMTTGALIFGMLPVAFGASSGSEFRAPMGMITVGGLLASTLLTLVVVPVVYCLLDSLSAQVWARAARLRRNLRSPREGDLARP